MLYRSFSRATMLAGKKYSDYLTRTDQSIHGEVHVKGDLTVRDDLKITNLRTMAAICGYDVSNIIGDTVMLNGSSRPILGNKSFVGEVNIGELAVHGGVLFELGTWTEILDHLQSVQNDITLQGPITFENRFRLKELLVEGELNRIPSGSFGRQWLLKDSDQVS